MFSLSIPPMCSKKRFLEYNEEPRKSILYLIAYIFKRKPIKPTCHFIEFVPDTNWKCKSSRFFFQLGNFFSKSNRIGPKANQPTKKEDKLHFWRKMGNTSRKDTAVVARFYVQINSSSRTQRK